jgi:ZIP family zinc transporter
MMNPTVAASLVFAVAEAAGAWFYHKTGNLKGRRLMSAFGLGFAATVVLCDVLPDATEHDSIGYLLAACAAVGTFAIWKRGNRESGEHAGSSLNSIAVGGMALHNFAEGAVLASIAGPLSLLFVVGAILHKVPEGMATYTLLGEKKSKRNLAIAIGSSLLIPVGVMARIPAGIEQPLMALVSGVILAAVATTMAGQKAEELFPSVVRKAAPYLAGALVGGISCLLV